MFNNIEELKDEIKSGISLTFKVKVSAGAKNNSIDFCEDFIKIRIQAHAIEGKANKAIIEFLSELVKIPKSKIKIISGQHTSIKIIRIEA